MVNAQGGTLSEAASSLGTALTDTYSDLAAVKYQEYQLAYTALRMSLGLLTNILGRTVNGIGTTFDLAGSGVGAIKSYSTTGAEYIFDAAQSGLKSAATASGSAGESTKSYGANWIKPTT